MGLGRCFHSTDSLRIEGDGVTSTPPDSSLMVDRPNAGTVAEGVPKAGSLCCTGELAPHSFSWAGELVGDELTDESVSGNAISTKPT